MTLSSDGSRRPAYLRRLAVAAVVAGAMLGGHAAAHPRCFGAAARDPEHQPCVNPALRTSVVPAPGVAQIEPSAPCKPLGGDPDVCAFGVRSARAAQRIALVGDSHAVHWRAALDVIARRKRWHALTLYRSECPFTAATAQLPQPERSQCRRWGRRVVRWFEAHPEVRTVFVSEHSRSRVVVPPGRDEYAARVRGYVDAWRALPASVKHIVVIRDPPYIATTTMSCIRRARARRDDAGAACALPRDTALRPDPAMDAVQRSGARVRAIDLTEFMCDDALCYPVVGGVLVKKDAGHLTRLFATTLAPYLRRALERLARQ